MVILHHPHARVYIDRMWVRSGSFQEALGMVDRRGLLREQPQSIGFFGFYFSEPMYSRTPWRRMNDLVIRKGSSKRSTFAGGGPDEAVLRRVVGR
jgi:hypothetical protein